MQRRLVWLTARHAPSPASRPLPHLPKPPPLEVAVKPRNNDVLRILPARSSSTGRQ